MVPHKKLKFKTGDIVKFSPDIRNSLLSVSTLPPRLTNKKAVIVDKGPEGLEWDYRIQVSHSGDLHKYIFCNQNELRRAK